MSYKIIIKQILLLVSIGCYTSALSYPLLIKENVFLWITWSHNEITVFNSIEYFINERDFLLAGLIFVFVLIFPILKYLSLLVEVFGLPFKNYSISSSLDKWSMLDVFIVAFFIVFSKTSSFLNSELAIGTYLLSASIILRMILPILKVKRTGS